MDLSSTATPTTSCEIGYEVLTFRYAWTLKIKKRLIANDDSAILHVSSPFCTAYNGCQFTWILRMCDQNVLEMVESFDDQPSSSVNKRVNITLYYKDGPTPDVFASAAISVNDSNGQPLLKDSPLGGYEYTLGAGWSPWVSENGGDDWLAFSEFVHSNAGAQISVCVDLRIKASVFQPFNYLPSIESANSKLETICETTLKDIYTKKLVVPDSEFFNPQTDKFAYHRHIFKFACREVERRVDDALKTQITTSKIHTVFAHIYFNHVIMAETVCFEDFVEILEASIATNFPELRRECERFICREIVLESADLEFVKKMLLLAARFDLPVLKMVSSGALVDKLISANQQSQNLSKNIHQEFLQLAEKITHSEEDDADDEASNDGQVEHLVHNVVDQLQSLAKHIRRVSLSASCGSLSNSPSSSSSITPTTSNFGIFAAPQPAYSSITVPNAGHVPPAGRRCSLKTSRELLTFPGNASSLDSDNPASQNSSPLLGTVNPRRRSIMFSLQTYRFEDEEEESGVGSSTDSTDGGQSTDAASTIRIQTEPHFALQVSP